MRALFFACLRAVIKFSKKSTAQGLKSIIIYTFFASFAAQNCYLIIDHVNNASGSRSDWRQHGVTKSTFCLLVCLFFRLHNSPYFCVFKYARAVKRGWKQRARLGRDAKNTDCPFCIRYIRSNYPLLPATGNSHWLNFDASCQVMFSTSHSRWSIPWWIAKAVRCKMTDVDRLDLLARIGICFKIGAEGSFGVATQRKGCFLCSTNRIWQKP